MFDSVCLQNGNETRIVNPLAVNGQSLHELEPVRKNFRRILKDRKTVQQIGDFLSCPLPAPSETVCILRPCGYCPELDEILPCNIDLVTLAQ